MDALGWLVHEAVVSGGNIDEVRETRLERSGEHEFHFDLRLTVEDVPVYIETRLHDYRPFGSDRPWIEVDSVHAP